MWFIFAIASVSAWATVNILDSILVNRYVSSPLFIGWFLYLFYLPVYPLMVLYFDLRSEFALVLFLMGLIGGLGDYMYFYVLNKVDASVSNGAWGMLAIIVSTIGLVFLGEVWTLSQGIGAVLIIVGVMMLSFWHKYISSGWTLILLASVAALFAPTFVTQKIALDAGSSIPTVFFWSVIPRGLMILILPWLIRGQRMKLLKTFRSLQWDFYLVAGIAASALFVAHTTSQLAMRHGPISLFSVVGNAQPFFVIIICYLLSLFLPERLLPKEVLSAQSLQTKAACFVVVLVGLTLFAIS